MALLIYIQLACVHDEPRCPALGERQPVDEVATGSGLDTVDLLRSLQAPTSFSWEASGTTGIWELVAQDILAWDYVESEDCADFEPGAEIWIWLAGSAEVPGWFASTDVRQYYELVLTNDAGTWSREERTTMGGDIEPGEALLTEVGAEDGEWYFGLNGDTEQGNLWVGVDSKEMLSGAWLAE